MHSPGEVRRLSHGRMTVGAVERAAVGSLVAARSRFRVALPQGARRLLGGRPFWIAIDSRGPDRPLLGVRITDRPVADDG